MKRRRKNGPKRALTLRRTNAEEMVKLLQEKSDIVLKHMEEVFQMEVDMVRQRHDLTVRHLNQKHDLQLEIIKEREVLLFASNGSKKSAKKQKAKG